jgi:hypothetical protein
MKRFNTNSIWLPEASGTGGQVPGYADWAALYGFYRVIGYKYTVLLTNKEAFDVECYTINSNNDPGTTTNALVTSNPNSQLAMLGAKGSGRDQHTFSSKYKIATIAGTEAIYTADTYRSLIGANPTDVLWLGVGLQSFSGTISTGVDISVQISLKTIMYDYLLQAPMALVAYSPRHFVPPQTSAVQTRVSTEDAIKICVERENIRVNAKKQLKEELAKKEELGIVC